MVYCAWLCAAYVPEVYDGSSSVSGDRALANSDGIHPSKEGELKESTSNAIAILNDLLLMMDYIQANKEKAFLYTALGVAVGIILILLACIIVQCTNKRKPKSNQMLHLAKSTEFSSLIDSNQTSP
ncbi:unnamed protein product, partial [Anisakis simplex]|uniref:LRRNT_2 domain-containing protein n=1 Tax=Anisakis simplex TaxID=6269 RepID=A0A0M3KJD0_ANISI